ncbi:FixH family protein [Myxococcota bacterium]|nr:FixH family protein [Myxococcota bacterium]
MSLLPPVILLASLAVAVAGCGGGDPPGGTGPEVGSARAGAPAPGVPSPPPPPGATEGLTTRGLYRVRYETEPSPIPLGQLFTVRTTVTDAASGVPVTGGTVSVNARMPDHGHGMETAPESAPGDPTAGEYVTRGMKFHMPGSWTLTVDVGGDRPDHVAFVHVVP